MTEKAKAVTGTREEIGLVDEHDGKKPSPFGHPSGIFCDAEHARVDVRAKGILGAPVLLPKILPEAVAISCPQNWGVWRQGF